MGTSSSTVEPNGHLVPLSKPAIGDEITISPSELRSLGDRFQKLLLEYRFALKEVETKLDILRDEFLYMHDYQPVEHVSGRVKSIDSLMAKIDRIGIEPELDAIREHVRDIAGVRVTCAFRRDVYRLFSLLTQQDDVTVLEVEDYIKEPKPNGYKSLHATISVPVYLSSGRVDVPVEVQFRTIAMDFWASLEHKIYYKYDRQVPDGLTEELKSAADTAAELDARMEQLHVRLHGEPMHTTPIELPWLRDESA